MTTGSRSDAYTVECWEAMRESAILPLAATPVDPEGIVPSEGSQAETDKYHIISLIWKLKRFMVVRGGRG